MNRTILFAFFLLTSLLSYGQFKDANDDEIIIHEKINVLEEFQRPELKTKRNGGVRTFVVKVHNQQQFDDLSHTLISSLEAGYKNIIVRFKKGTYYYKEGHLKLVNHHYPDADISFEGMGSTIVSKGWKLEDGDTVPCAVNGESCFININRKQSILPWGEMMYADSLVEVIDVSSKHCRLKCSQLGGLKVSGDNMAYLDLTRWCRCYQYKVLGIENGYVDFYAHDLAIDDVFRKTDFNVNYDYIYAKTNPRFRLCNVDRIGPISVIDSTVYLSPELSSVYFGFAVNFITIKDCSLHQLSFKGLTILGSRGRVDPLIDLTGVTSSVIEFKKCSFIGQRRRIMNITNTDNVWFHDNYVSDNYDWGIVSDNTSSFTIIEKNIFENNGVNLSYNRVISCSGQNYYIGHNSFKNFGYCAISVGVPYSAPMEHPSSGIIEYNHIFYDKEHFENAWKYTIMDSGAIYVWTQNGNTIIRYNYIHDYTGMRQNRGIYLDDGASNVSVYGNVVMNIPNWHAIDSRLVSSTERTYLKTSFSEKNNLNNLIAYNITDGTINIVGREQVDNGCMKGYNIILENNLERPHREKFVTTYENLTYSTSDVSSLYMGHDSKGVVLSRYVYRGLKAKEPALYGGVKRFVR